MTYFVVIRGPAGVGKTTVSKRLAKQLNMKYISLDEVLHNETNLEQRNTKSVPKENWKEVNEIIIPRANEILKKGKNVIFDGNFYHKDYLLDLVKNIKTKGYVFTLKACVETCMKREKKRDNKYKIGKKEIEIVHEMASQFSHGIDIETDGKSVDEVINEIKKHLEI